MELHLINNYNRLSEMGVTTGRKNWEIFIITAKTTMHHHKVSFGIE